VHAVEVSDRGHAPAREIGLFEGIVKDEQGRGIRGASGRAERELCSLHGGEGGAWKANASPERSELSQGRAPLVAVASRRRVVAASRATTPEGLFGSRRLPRG
jgi:hypothetical protein